MSLHYISCRQLGCAKVIILYMYIKTSLCLLSFMRRLASSADESCEICVARQFSRLQTGPYEKRCDFYFYIVYNFLRHLSTITEFCFL